MSSKEREQPDSNSDDVESNSYSIDSNNDDTDSNSETINSKSDEI